MRWILLSLASLALAAVTAVVIFVWQNPGDQAPPPAPETTATPASLPVSLPAAAMVVDDPRFAAIALAAQEEIATGHLPGAVVLLGHQSRVVYRQAFGQRCLEPQPQPMTVETVFDLASLTKVLATATAVMQLSDRGLLRIDDHVTKYWPEFGQHGKECLTLRQLLTHTSGLQEEIDPRAHWSDYREALEAIAMDRLFKLPKTGFRYSDTNFIVLGELVRRVSGQPLNVYCAENIFKPLKMQHTSFNPPEAWQAGTAPCNLQNGRLRWGKVHDPNAYRMGGVAGHAGVFSTADDLAVFAQMMLNRGKSCGASILNPGTVAAMTKPQTISGGPIIRGLGWDIRSPFTQEFNASFPAGSYGHTGFTGPSIWIDPGSQTYLIILTNRLHPRGQGRARPLRAKIAAAVAAAVPMGPPAGVSELGGISK